MLVLCALAGAPTHAAPPAVASALLDASSDTLVTRTVVPDPARKIGEVRLLRRGGAVVVQTLLATKLLPRAVAEIRLKEERNWPDGQEGAADRARYLDALAQAADTLRSDAESTGDRRLRLLIEFIAADGASVVHLAGFDADEVDGALVPTARRPIATLALGRPYVFPNMRLILADSFAIPVGDVDRLGPLGPIAQDKAAPPSSR